MQRIVITTVAVAIAAVIGIVSASPAQAAPSIYPGALVPGALPGGIEMASADLNGDGLTDLMVADNSTSGTSPDMGGVWVFLAQKGGGYSAPVFYATASRPYTLAVGDLDGDGRPDIVTGNAGSATANQLSVLINNGDGTFKPHVDYSPAPSAIFAAISVTVADATGDGKADVVLGTGTTSVYLVPGNGDGTLNTAAVESLVTTYAIQHGVAVADLNSDGKPDIVVASGCGSTGEVDVFLGGSGAFTNPNQSVPVGVCPSLAVADVNGDTAPDVVVGNFYDSTVQVLLNSGGSLADSGTTYTLPAGSQPQWTRLADVDGDGHVDIMAPGFHSDAVNVLYGRGDGTFDQPTSVPVGYGSADVAAVDANTDGKLDLVSLDSSVHALAVARNLGSRGFYTYANYAYQNAGGQGQGAGDMVSVDLNGDGKPDVVTANYVDHSLSVLLNNGQGGFGAPNLYSAPAAHLDSLVGADVNGDGKPDIVTADSSGHLYTYLGAGDGALYSPLTNTIGSGLVYGLALGDVDGDGIVDIAAAVYGGNQVQICKGDGAGNFDCSAHPALAVSHPYRVLLTDLNGDQQLDLVVTAAISGDAYVFVGDGKGGFGGTPYSTLPITDNGWGISAGDVNGDSVPDLVFGAFGNKVTLFKGLTGAFGFGGAITYASGLLPDSSPYFLSLADLNGDGKLDIAAANYNESTLSLLTNKGDGSFNPALNYAAGDTTYPILAIDVDGDGLTDIVTANWGDYRLVNSTVSVYLHNHAPVAMGTSLTVNENTSGTGSVTATNAEQDPLTFAVATQPGHGSVNNLDASTGRFTYTPTSGYSGSDGFTVTATNGLETSTPATVSITVKPSSSGGGGGGGGALGLFNLFVLGLLLAPALRRRLG